MRVAVKKISNVLLIFRVPLLVAFGIVGYLIFQYLLKLTTLSTAVIISTIFIGSLRLLKDTATALVRRNFALDYIALLAITVGVLTQQYLVAAVIVLMLAGGNTLEEYGMRQAQASLTALTERIPSSVHLWEQAEIGRSVDIGSVAIGEEIVIRKGEVVALDGILQSKTGLTDESSLTGEPYMIDKVAGDQIRSGTVNVGNIMIVKVTKTDEHSTYRKIIDMVKAAQKEKAPLIRLADRYSAIFTLVALVFSAVAYFLTHDFTRVLAVLVIATPCPLILATPIALMGGMNAAAKKRIIMKKISSIEVLSRVNTIIFDKTGTITLGKPVISKVSVKNAAYSLTKIYSIAAAIERNSLHPLAKAIVTGAKQHQAPVFHPTHVTETIGMGISAQIYGKKYKLAKVKDFSGMAIALTHEDQQLAVFEFEDQIKSKSKTTLKKLEQLGLQLLIFTGDKKEAADKIVAQLVRISGYMRNVHRKIKKTELQPSKLPAELLQWLETGLMMLPH